MFTVAPPPGILETSTAAPSLSAVKDEMAGAAIGKQKTRTLQGAATPFGVVLFKEGDGPGGFNTLMAFHPRSDTIFIGFTNEFGNFDEVDTMMADVMSAAIPLQ